MFDMLCHANGIEHRLTKPKPLLDQRPSRANNRTLKEATVQRYQYDTHAQLTAHVHAFLMAYNFAKRVKTLSGLTPGVWCEAGPELHLEEVLRGRSARPDTEPLKILNVKK